MSNRVSNLPQNQLKNLPEGTSSEVISSLRELHQLGKPLNVQELKSRIDAYFEFCAQHDFRCGIESLCLSLGVSRTAFWKWTRHENCTDEWAQVCESAKQFITSFLEQISLKGRLTPPVSIFLMKNWCGYKDNFSLDDTAANAPHTPIALVTMSDIARKYGIDADDTGTPQGATGGDNEQLPF